ncbi:MAG: hypothetical protein ACKO0U_10310 [Gammaproteobacteria bacterium]
MPPEAVDLPLLPELPLLPAEPGLGIDEDGMLLEDELDGCSRQALSDAAASKAAATVEAAVVGFCMVSFPVGRSAGKRSRHARR